MNNVIKQLPNGDWEVLPTSIEVQQTKERTMKKATTINNNNNKKDFKTKSCDFILLSPLAPSLFGYDDGEVSRMVSELEDLGISTLMVDTGRELSLYARCGSKDTLEKLCTVYDIGGILVEATAIYDQVVVTELAN